MENMVNLTELAGRISERGICWPHFGGSLTLAEQAAIIGALEFRSNFSDLIVEKIRERFAAPEHEHDYEWRPYNGKNGKRHFGQCECGYQTYSDRLVPA